MVVTVIIAAVAALMHYLRAAEHGGLSDFATVWNGARLLIQGANPYDLIGPGRTIEMPSPPYYPATAFVTVLPLAWMPVHAASTIFVLMSASLLVFGATRNGWHLLPIFPSVAFITSAQTAQWSMIYAAAVFYPALCAIAAAKPQASLPIVLSEKNRKGVIAALIGTVLLAVIATIMLPSWWRDWLNLVKGSNDFSPPIFHLGGFLILAVLIKWRRPEAWLILIAAILPQTWYPYNSLVLMLVASTYHEACALSLISTAGWVASALLVDAPSRSPQVRSAGAITLVLACYLPAVIVVLRRKNTGPSPWWMKPFLKQHSSFIFETSGR